ncbi:glycosyltransferase, partial [bacterium]|nr:glycosyltransferase [bacterium]
MILNENKKYDISVIIPIYNEQDNIEVLFNRLKEVFEKTKKNYEIVFVNDGSADNSSLMLSKLY